ncbi:MAG TPA: methyltransferase domain-containing protein [Thermoanaerobaculia bacterium]
MTGILRHWWRTARKSYNAWRCRRLPPGGKLHVGCGPVHLDGWINIDVRRYRGVDYVLDVRDGLPFHDLRFVFAEHFIEHLPYWECERFLRDCRSALADDGVLRLSTPNLDWVVATQYGANDAIRNCFALNTSFRGWGHQFLFNATTLAALLRRAGFADVRFLTYGNSRHEELRGLERHEKSPDSVESPHVLVVEAGGVGAQTNPTLDHAARGFLETLGAS